MLKILTALAIAITATSYSYNPKDFYEEDGYLQPTGKYHGNAIVQMGDEYICYDAHNVNADIVIGDVNCDNEISVADLVLLTRFTTEGVELPQWGNADINSDEVVNVEDCETLRSILIEEEDKE